MKDVIWIEPCGCGITEFNKDGKEVRQYRHDRVSLNGVDAYAPMTMQTDGFDANGAVVPAEYPF